jgi:ribonuclease T1
MLRRAFLLLVLAVLLGAGQTLARGGSHASGEVALTELPQEARDTLALIRRGGPFRHRQDGIVFGNREKRLPAMERGYYREYTVPTPGAKDRGARRIVAGSGPGNDVRSSGEYYYSDDHYNSFRRIRDRQ